MNIELYPEIFSGPLNCVANSTLAKKLLGRGPKVWFADGRRVTADLYFPHRDREGVEFHVTPTLNCGTEADQREHVIR